MSSKGPSLPKINFKGLGEQSSEEDAQPDSENPAREDIYVENARDLQSYRRLRESYAFKAFVFACVCVGFWMLMMIWLGIGSYYKTTPVFSDKVAIAITTATCVNLFAAFLGVIRGLFPANGNGSP